MNTYVVARGAKGRATLMHRLDPSNTAWTVCGNLMAGWSRAYMPKPIPQIMCKKCTKEGN